MKKNTTKNKIAILKMAIKTLNEKPLSHGMCFQIEHAERNILGRVVSQFGDLSAYGIFEPAGLTEDETHWYPQDEQGRITRLNIMTNAINRLLAD